MLTKMLILFNLNQIQTSSISGTREQEMSNMKQ